MMLGTTTAYAPKYDRSPTDSEKMMPLGIAGTVAYWIMRMKTPKTGRSRAPIPSAWRAGSKGRRSR